MSAAPATSAVTAALRLGIALLGATGFALSYDALQQMAVAIHIRGPLTYTFPLVIDGFIAIGVGALLILRTGPWRSRLYVWVLVGVATLTSIWANALHAVRLNQQQRPGNLHLDNITVGSLSAVAPLALAGAVHLYLVVMRHPAQDPKPSHETLGIPAAQEPTVTDVAPERTDVARDSGDVAPGAAEALNAPQPTATSQSHASNELGEVDAERLALARTAPLGRGGRASRRHIEDTFRSRNLTIGRTEADRLKDLIQTELDEAAASSASAQEDPTTAHTGAGAV